MSDPVESKSSRVGGLGEPESTAATSDETRKSEEIPASLKAHIERNRQKALLLKQARLSPHPYAKMCVEFSVSIRSYSLC